MIIEFLKKSIKKINLFFLLVFFAPLNLPVFADTYKECLSPLVLSSTINWYPYIYQNPQSETTGTDVELLRIVLQRLGCELEVVTFPERRSALELKKGNLDVWLGASFNNERQANYWYSEQYRYEVNRFAYRNSDTDVANITELKELVNLKKVIAINLAGWYGNEIEKIKAESNNFVFSDTVGNRLKMLSLKRIDAVIDDDLVLCSEIEKMAVKGLSIHSLILYEAPIYFIFNKASISEKFVKQFNLELASMRKSGLLSSHFTQNIPASCLNR